MTVPQCQAASAKCTSVKDQVDGFAAEIQAGHEPTQDERDALRAQLKDLETLINAMLS
jgi:hypothetical protein